MWSCKCLFGQLLPLIVVLDTPKRVKTRSLSHSADLNNDVFGRSARHDGPRCTHPTASPFAKQRDRHPKRPTKSWPEKGGFRVQGLSTVCLMFVHGGFRMMCSESNYNDAKYVNAAFLLNSQPYPKEPMHTGCP